LFDDFSYQKCIQCPFRIVFCCMQRLIIEFKLNTASIVVTYSMTTDEVHYYRYSRINGYLMAFFLFCFPWVKIIFKVLLRLENFPFWLPKITDQIKFSSWQISPEVDYQSIFTIRKSIFRHNNEFKKKTQYNCCKI